ncbi:Hsp20 family protein [Deltaproteobacteria bacterium TL4]
MKEEWKELDELLERKRRSDKKLAEFQQRTFDFQEFEKKHIDAIYDLYVIGNTLYLDIELPGVFRNDINIQLSRSKIIISGYFPTPIALNEGVFIEHKRKRGSFEYIFILPEDMIVEHYDAQLANGILYLKMELQSQSKQKKLPSTAYSQDD